MAPILDVNSVRVKCFIAVVTLSVTLCAAFEGAAPNVGLVIPNHLIVCYENKTLYDRATRLPSTMSSLIALIAKIERAGGLNMDMRTLTTALLYQYRVDGIQRAPEIPWVPGVVPFTPNGRQHAKYRVLKENLIPPGNFLPDEGLRDFEKCSLHFMLSSSVSLWERGDEHDICPLEIGGRSIGVNANVKKPPSSWSEWPDENEKPTEGKATVSRCPIENGVLWTPWGSVNAGTVLASIAAALQPQRVPLSMLIKGLSEGEEHSEALDNKWAASLAGDLAEVAVYQGPRAMVFERMRLGPGGMWNDTAIPRAMYMDPWLGTPNGWEHESWDMTESELLGGIDGIVLAQNLPRWLDLQSKLRLSQVLDMFYSERGVCFDNEIRACRRQDLYRQQISFDTLREQTQNFVSVLYEHTPEALPMDAVMLKKFADDAIKAGIRFAENVMTKDSEYYACPQFPLPIPRVEALVVLDGSWTTWEAQRVVGTLDRSIDVSEFGSEIAVMNGYTGAMMANFTRLSTYSVLRVQNSTNCNLLKQKFKTVFYDLSQKGPIGLDLEKTIREAKTMFLHKRAVQARRGANVAAASRGTAVVVLAPTATLSQTVLENAKEEFRIFHSLLPDVRFFFVVSRNKDDFSHFVEEPNVDIIQVASNEMDSYIPKLVERLRAMPGRILPPMCPSLVKDSFFGQAMKEWMPVEPKGPLFEDYVSVDDPRIYRIPKEQLVGTSKVSITFKNANYGDLILCISRTPPEREKESPPMSAFQTPPEQESRSLGDEVQERCYPLRAGKEHTFQISKPCFDWDVQACKPIYFLLRVEATDTNCLEKDCRFPNQVRFSLQHFGLKPLPGCPWEGNNGFAITPDVIMFVVSVLLYIAIAA